ncbi:MAG: dipeptide epimerase [Bacteroidota bacterium]
MKIKKVEILRENLELTRPYTIAYKTVSSVENVFLLLHLANGQIGIGCAAPSEGVTGESVPASMQALQTQVEPLLHGANLIQFPSLLKQARQLLSNKPAAMTAIDLALHDAFCQWQGIRLVDWWGLEHERLPTSITIGIADVEETLAQAAEHMAAGFKVIKLKTGRGVEEDVAVFRKLREAVGPTIKIRVDANQGYQPDDLQAFAKATAQLDVEFYEQPFPAGHSRGKVQEDQLLRGADAQLAIPATLRKLCAADEDLHHATDALRLAVEPQPFGVFNIKLMKCGGGAEARRIAFIAERSGIELMWGCNDESCVSITGALHAALASPATRYLDLDGSLDLARDLVTGGFVLEDGYLRVGEGSGLGVRLL